MNFKLDKGGQVEVILVFKDADTVDGAPELYSYLKEKDIFKGKASEIYTHLSYKGDNVILLGLGEEKDISFNVLRKAFHKLGKELMANKVESIGLTVPKFEGLCYRKTNMAIAEGLLQSEYSFEKFLSKKKTRLTLKDVYLDVLADKKDKVQQGIEEVETLIEGIFLTRDLVNEPAINMYPETLAKAAKDNLEGLGVDVVIYGKEKIKELGMEAFLAVAEGSNKEPQFIIMTYNGDSSSQEKIALVGKGLTYDSGGYCLKPADSMAAMHSDMAGSATVIGAMKSIAKSKLKRNVVAIVAACENMISGGAYKTGDIIGSMSGKTIEIGNTDAEGRVTLADALWYAATVVKADKIIDLATLTGACVVALGSINTGAITNNGDLMQEVKDASEVAGEYVWELPNNEEYKELNKSHFADIKNTGGRYGGAITAGLFLSEFVNDIPWVHLDIAGTSFISKDRGYLPKGGTGVPVKTIYYLVKGN